MPPEAGCTPPPANAPQSATQKPAALRYLTSLNLLREDHCWDRLGLLALAWALGHRPQPPDAAHGTGRAKMRTYASGVLVSQIGDPAVRQRHRCRAPVTAAMPPLTWKGLIVPLPARPGQGPVPCAQGGTGRRGHG